MIFEPLRIAADDLRTVGSFQILEVNQWFPTGFHSQRITITFCKAIHKIDSGIKIFHPKNSIFIEVLQTACFIKLNQFADHCLLRIIFSYRFRFLQPVYDLFNRLSIKSAYFPYFFLYFSILFDQTAVQSVWNRSFIFRIFHCSVEAFRLLLSNSVIIIAGRSQHQVFTIRLIYTFRHDSRIKHYREKLVTELFSSLSFRQRK